MLFMPIFSALLAASVVHAIPLPGDGTGITARADTPQQQPPRIIVPPRALRPQFMRNLRKWLDRERESYKDEFGGTAPTRPGSPDPDDTDYSEAAVIKLQEEYNWIKNELDKRRRQAQGQAHGQAEQGAPPSPSSDV